MLGLTGAALGAAALGVPLTGVAAALPQYYLVAAPDCEALGHVKFHGSAGVERVRLVARPVSGSTGVRTRACLGATDPETDVESVPGTYRLLSTRPSGPADTSENELLWPAPRERWVCSTNARGFACHATSSWATAC